MGLFDRIQLISPLPCYECNATERTILDKNEGEGTIDVGDKKLKVIRFHDGTGGIKIFQTKDLEYGSGSMTTYFFPGYVRGSMIKDLKNRGKEKTTLDLTEICNACSTIWKGSLEIKYDPTENEYLTKALEIRPLHSQEEETELDLEIRQQETPSYDLSFFSSEKVRIVPKIGHAREEYLRRAETHKQKAETYKTLLESISSKEVPLEQIISELEEYVSNRTPSQNLPSPLTQSLVLLEKNSTIQLAYHSALTASVIILERSDKGQASQILEFLTSAERERFKKDREDAEWFFMSPEQLEQQNPISRIFGCIGGPNMFLNSIKEKSKR